ncbi:MAG: AAA family ATPase [Novosphingobium sp.]|nr:AAA family ATPase [Novosphingobium sp.]MCP5401947.1 AAA family ATPase [Novosphingobium sp.]
MTTSAPTSVGGFAAEYARHGLALCAIPLGKKGPITKGWNLRVSAITNSTEAAKLTGNLGLLHAFSGTMALDVDDDEQAREWLLARGVDPRQLVTTPDHVGIISGRKGRGKLLYRLPKDIAPIETLKIKDAADRTILEFRCADSGGNSVQDLLPPSIHPDTGQPYRWGGPGDWRIPPVIPDALLKVWRDGLAQKSMANLLLPPQPLMQSSYKRNDLPADTPENRAELARLLRLSVDGQRVFDPNAGHDEWLPDVWSIAAIGAWTHDAAREWSKEGRTFDPHKFEQDWASFDPSRAKGITEKSFFAKLRDAGVKHNFVTRAASPSGVPPVPLQVQAPPLPVPPAPPLPSLPLLMTARQLRQMPTPPYVVRNVLPAHGLASIYGEPGSGKSFLALHLAHTIALCSADWFGFHVRQKPVVYVALEGMGGIGKRTTALELHSKRLCPDQLRFWCRDIHLMTGDGIELLASEIISAVGKGAVVIIDTLNQASPGADENSSQDMGKIIANSKRLAAAVEGLVILVHHSGKKASQGMRGHSSLLAAMDTVIEVTKSAAGRKWSITKAKDDSADVERDFDLVPYQVGQDGFGPITSCAVQQTAHVMVPNRRPPTGKNQKPALAELHRLLPSPGQTIDYEAALKHVAAVLTTSKGREKERAKAAVDALVEEGHLLKNEKGLSVA